MATTDELLDILMKDYKKPEDLIGEKLWTTNHQIHAMPYD